jgi:hypothetical protein
LVGHILDVGCASARHAGDGWVAPA